MKYSEFIQIAENEDYTIRQSEGEIIAINKNEEGLTLNKIIIYKDLDECGTMTINSCGGSDFEVIKAAIELTKTPLEEREEEKTRPGVDIQDLLDELEDMAYNRETYKINKVRNKIDKWLKANTCKCKEEKQ